MRKASCIVLTVVAFAATFTQAVQTRSLVQRAPPQGFDRSYAQVAAAAMWPDLAKMEQEVVPNVVNSLGDDLKRAVQDRLRFKLANLSKLRLAQSADAEAARYILAEIGQGHASWLKALGQVSDEAARLEGPAVKAQTESSMSLWEKIKSFFSRKQPQNKAEVSSAELDAAVE